MNTREKLELLKQIRERNDERVREFIRSKSLSAAYMVEKHEEGKLPNEENTLMVMEAKPALIIAKAMWIAANKIGQHVSVIEFVHGKGCQTIWCDGLDVYYDDPVV